MTFFIEYDKSVQHFLEKVNKGIAKRIIDKIEFLLLNDPVPHTAKSIVGEKGVFRLRIGDYRALYRIDYVKNKIIIFHLDKRSNVYK